MRPIPLSGRIGAGRVALVDDDDYDRLISVRWYLNEKPGRPTVYAQRRWTKPDEATLMHRVILNAPAGLEVDHIDGNGLNNQKGNLRLVTSAQNRQNLHAFPMRGVSVEKKTGRWRARVKLNGREHTFGTYATQAEAAMAAACGRAQLMTHSEN